MNPYEKLPEAERIRRIGELLATAAIRYLEEQPLPPRQSQQRPPVAATSRVWDLVEDEIEKQILRYLEVHVAAGPVQMEGALNVPQRTLARRLERLFRAGLLVVSGKTKGALYGVAAHIGGN